MTHSEKVQARAELLMDVCGLKYADALQRADIEIKYADTTPQILYTMAQVYAITDSMGISFDDLCDRINLESKGRFYLTNGEPGIRKTFRETRGAKLQYQALTFSDWKRVIQWVRLLCEKRGQPFPHLAGNSEAWKK